MRRVLVAAVRVVCVLASIAIVVAVFGLSMVWVTGWLWEAIVDGADGWKDTLGRVILAVIAAPIVGMSAGLAAGAVVGAPLYGLLRLIGVDQPLRRRRATKPDTNPTVSFPPLEYPPPPSTEYPPPRR